MANFGRKNTPPFPVNPEDKNRTESPYPPIVINMHEEPPVLPPRTDPNAREISPQPTISSEGDLLSATTDSSRRPSLLTVDLDSRRGSVQKMGKEMVKDLRKGVKNVTDHTKNVGNKMKDKTSNASQWVANQTSKKAKQAMDQAMSKLSLGEKFTLFATEKISALSKKGLTHILMFMVLIGYTALGAALFMLCEGGNEKREKINIEIARKKLINLMWNQAHQDNDFGRYTVAIQNELSEFETQLLKSFNNGYTYEEEEIWTFWKSMFFCSTITTTIGYGHISPSTPAGKALTIVYALIGIPLFLILMADFGKLFTRMLKSMFISFRKFYASDTCVRLRHTSAYQRIAGRLNAIKQFICFWEEEKHVVYGPNGEVIDPYLQDGNFNIPISFALTILIVYIFIGCIIYPLWETWTHFDAFYFIFISMTTIGFGDLVPVHPAYMMLTTIYLVFGLALTAMCINIIQEKLTDTFRQASLKMKTTYKKIMEAAAKQEEENEGADEVEDRFKITVFGNK